MCFIPLMYFRMALPCMYFHTMCTSTTCTFNGMSKHGPRKHVMGMQFSVFMVPCVIMYVIVKLQLNCIVAPTDLFGCFHFTNRGLVHQFMALHHSHPPPLQECLWYWYNQQNTRQFRQLFIQQLMHRQTMNTQLQNWGELHASICFPSQDTTPQLF